MTQTLTECQLKLLRYVAKNIDLTNKEIACQLHLSHRTVSNTLGKIYEKLGVNNRAGAVKAALAQEILRPEELSFIPPHKQE